MQLFVRKGNDGNLCALLLVQLSSILSNIKCYIKGKNILSGPASITEAAIRAVTT